MAEPTDADVNQAYEDGWVRAQEKIATYIEEKRAAGTVRDEILDSIASGDWGLENL